MILRPVESSDRAEWIRLRRALWPEDAAVHAAEVDRFFQGPRKAPQAVFVVDGEDGTLLGFAEVSVRGFAEGCATDHVGYLEGWYVAPAHRRRGIGRGLVERAEAWARAQGCAEFASDADWDNEASARAHAACGFEEVALVRCFKKTL